METSGNDDYPPMTAPPWGRHDHDVMADLMRAVRVLGMAPAPPLPDVRAGSDQVFRDLASESGIQTSTGGAETLAMLGIPVRVTTELPENVVIIGDRVLMRRQRGDWITFPLSVLDYDGNATAEHVRAFRAP
jgi:hypothetical protein